jgi:hypothetical protein
MKLPVSAGNIPSNNHPHSPSARRTSKTNEQKVPLPGNGGTSGAKAKNDWLA